MGAVFLVCFHVPFIMWFISYYVEIV